MIALTNKLGVKTMSELTKKELWAELLAERTKVANMHAALSETIGDLRQLGWESATHKDKLVFLSLSRRLQDVHSRF